MDEELSGIENDDWGIPEEATSYSEFPPIEDSDEEVPVDHTADVEDLESFDQSTLGGGFDYSPSTHANLLSSRPGEEGIYVWEGGAYEESEYGGEFNRYDESEKEEPTAVQLKATSSVTREIPSSASSVSKISNSKTKPSPSSLHQPQKSTSSLLIQRPPEKPCVRERMRKWLNHDPAVEPHQESFLGVPYSERDRHLNAEDPCRSLYFVKDKYAAKSVGFEEEDKKKRHLCACKLKTWEPFKSTEVTNSKRDIAASSGTFKKPSASLMSLAEANPDTCRCGAKEKFSSEVPNLSKTQLAQLGSAGRGNEHERAEVLKKLGICTCSKEPQQPNEIQEDFKINARIRRKIHKLVVKLLEAKRCHCRKTGWMSSRRWPKKKQKCICKHLRKRQRQFQETINRIWQKERDRRVDLELQRLKEQKIEQLYKAIGPQLAAEYRQLAANAQKTRKKPMHGFTKKVLKEFGNQMQKYKLQSLVDGTAFTHYDLNDFSSFQYLELPSGSIYYGQFSPFGMEGRCIYQMCHGPIFVGTLVDGKMEGPGRLIYPNGGTVDGIFFSGALFEPRYTFADGLRFEPTGWKYCRMPDRRFVSEIIKGMNSPDNVQLCANHPARQIPKGCLDAGEGFYDPKKKIIIHPSTGKTVRIVNEHEGQWILKNCRREWFEEVPFSRYMYENWYAGTVFTPPMDEADWFAEEFPKVLLPYNNVDDVVEARKSAALAAGKIYGTPEVLDEDP